MIMAFSRRKWLCIAATAVLGCAQANMAGAAVGVGDKAPDFSLPSTTGKPIRLADFAGKKSLVLFFYIGAFTNG
jgi:cytochrome oxidase Cu insertion factor (SCO1/SenC/PrrC family)